MEEINQNQQTTQQVYSTPQVPQTPGQQSSKRWLIKYLLIGILGGIPFAIIVGIIAALAAAVYWSSTIPGFLEPNSWGILQVIGFGIYSAPIAWIIFVIMTLFIGYRHHQ